MIKIISLLIRKLGSFLERCRNKIVIVFLRLKYPNGQITFDSYLEKGCKIKCTGNSKLKIKNSIISKGTLIFADHGGDVEINNTFIGRNCVIVAREKITIDSNCQIAEMVVIRDQNHNFGAKGKTIAEQGFRTSQILIKKNVWLGAKVTVLAGSTISENSVVGTNAVVRGNLDANAVYVGVLAKKVKTL